MNWSPGQIKALERFRAWYPRARAGEAPRVFRLFGPAGSGKSSLMREMVSGIEGRVLFAAYTGKASSVMRRYGCPEATTVHRLIYTPKERSRLKLRELEQALVGLGMTETALRAKLVRQIAEERERLSRPTFALNPESEVRGAALVVLDECSMIDQRMGQDVESFGCPILVLGDPFQLPPVFGPGYFTGAEPDVLLTEIHRQALDNPIVALATDVREGRGLRLGRYGESAVVEESDLTEAMALEADQILVGTNRRRRAANQWVRRALGHTADTPEPGEKLVCLRNNHELGLLNGSLWRVTGVEAPDDMLATTVDLDIEPADGGDGEAQTVTARTEPFLGRDVQGYDPEVQVFDFGYALTTHKSQGSQWDSVLVVDESRVFRDDRDRWLYTAISRSCERVTIVR